MFPVVLRGARTHNLKGVDVELRPGEIVCVTGVSGAGKSSLAMDTLYAEGQRRFVESFSPYARQFLERLDRPPMDKLEPIAAGIAVDRRAPIKSSRSTVATMADLEPYLSALFAREAVPVCPTCGVLAERTDAHAAASRLVESSAGARAVVTYPVRVDGTEAFLDARESLLKDGYRRVLVAGQARDLDELAPSTLLEGGRGTLEVVVDRLRIGPKERTRLGSALEQAWARTQGLARVHLEGQEEPALVATGLVCPSCARSFAPPSPGMFSYQSPVGACPACRGFGRTIGIDFGKVIPDERLSLDRGAIRPWGGKSSQVERRLLKKYCQKHDIPMDRPWGELDADQKKGVLEGDGTWSGGRYPGVRKWFEWLETRTYKMHVRVLLSRYRAYEICGDCDGKRLSKASLAYRVAGLDLGAWHALEVGVALAKLDALTTTPGQGRVAQAELASRLRYLDRVGLGYLTLDRQARTLSGGEAQRVSLTAALGTALTGALFVLDEPTVGLHPSDVAPLLEAARELADRGNVVLVVEHDPQVIAAADRILELGPGAGREGGHVQFDGTPSEAVKRRELATARALSPPGGALGTGSAGSGKQILVRGARGHNLRGMDVAFPLGKVVTVTGPSGSGKSSLVSDILYRAAACHLGMAGDVERPIEHDRVEGLAFLADVSLVDQAPLGRTSRGNAATYSGAWNRIRAILAAEPEATRRRLGPGSFSFNVAGGRCEACAGEGSETIEMQFLADVVLVCPTCRGARFKPEVLEVRHRDKSVGDILGMTVAEALVFFAREPMIVRALGPLSKLGLGYLTLGQPLSTLSGGEAQRLKLARALAETKRAKLFVLDEPSAGLHEDEVSLVSDALEALVAGGASVVVVEHDLSLIARSDWVIELGPGGGAAGGGIVACGTPAELARRETRTGVALAARARGAKTFERSRKRAGHHEKNDGIVVLGAREHNLKEVSVTIPRGQVVVVTGPSGSGKSTLAFDVVFAEGQRRFLETLTPYARQFLPSLPRPNVDRVVGVPPAIALEQRTARAGSTSTVATVTEIAQYLRLLYAKVGDAHCPRCDTPVLASSPDEVLARIHAVRGEQLLLAPAVVARKGTYLDVFTAASRAGIARAIVDGEPASTDAPPRLKKTVEHSIDLVVFEGSVEELPREVLDRALSWGKGSVKLRRASGRGRATEDVLFSTLRACPSCGESVPELDPRFFSFATKQGQCEVCEGSGLANPEDAEADPKAAVALDPCGACGGSRLSALPRAQRLAGLRYHEATRMSIADAYAWSKRLAFTGNRARIAEAPQKELVRRLAFVEDVGLGYLALDRLASTLSGGEMQRLRLAAQLGSGLTGALYVLDEPTIGLHPRDTGRLIKNLRGLVDMGSTVLLVEHDADTIRSADYLIDLGPSGGRGGGRIIASGPPEVVLADPGSPTGRALAAERETASVRAALGPSDEAITLLGPRAHNLKVDRVDIPVGRLTVVAGVSGSGKSTLVTRVLFPAVRRALGLEAPVPGAHTRLTVPKSLARALSVDQSPIGRTPRSVPATFLGIFDEIRRLFAVMPEAKMRGYTPARFSFNTGAGGRCQACDGQGVVSHEMSFLPDVTTPCEACEGKRYEPSTLDVSYLGLSIGDVLDLSAEEALALFKAHPRIIAPLEIMVGLGVGYLKLGQGSHTLSGGEAQRLKLAAELATGARTKPTLYVLDEPTTGLHWADVAKLIAVFDQLVRRGDTVVVIEHHPGVIAAADWVIELGPEGGEAGGRLVAEGTPQSLAKKATATGLVLRDLMAPRGRPAARRAARPS
ncbi:MAG: excinuclease ABC subunit UvrA [Myxococcales bacterium]|nr:excinuclease ABC subunit UvrA [Myxococcales bacterium]